MTRKPNSSVEIPRLTNERETQHTIHNSGNIAMRIFFLCFVVALIVLAETTPATGQPMGPNHQRPAIAAPDITMPIFSGSNTGKQVVQPMPNSMLTLSSSLLNGGNRLVATQNADGGWGWPLTGGSALNTVGPIAMGMAHAYEYTGSTSQKNGLAKAGMYLLAKTNNFSPSDGYLATKLDKIFGGTTYTNHVRNNFYNKLAAGTYNRNGAGILFNTASYVQSIRTARANQSIPNLAAWDIGMGLVGAAACGAPTVDWVGGTKAEIDELNGNDYYDVIGLAGALYGLAYVNEEFDPTSGQHAAANSISDLAATLASYQISGGGFTWNSNYMSSGDETIQETAYSILALNQVNRTAFLTNIQGAADYMIGTQLGTGGWKNWSGDVENNEITGEALWGIGVAWATVTVTVNDHNGAGIFGASVRWADGSWHGVGITGMDGTLSFNIPNPNWGKIAVTYHQGTVEKSKAQCIAESYTWQTVLARIRLLKNDCSTVISEPVGGTVSQGGGYWETIGNTGALGHVDWEVFSDRTYKFRMKYHQASQEAFFTIPAGGGNADFPTSLVQINYNGLIEMNFGSWGNYYTNPMYLLPVNHPLYFSNGGGRTGPINLTPTACGTVTNSYVSLKVLDEANKGVQGGKATPAYAGVWGTTLAGQTDANGNLFSPIPPGFTKISMTVNQGTVEQSLAQLTASNYTWKTQILRIWLKDHSGNAITSGGTLRQGGGYWYDWGSLNASGYRDIQLFPSTYKFEVTYKYTSETKFPVVVANAGVENYYFQTGQVFGSCITEYSTGAWRTFTNGMELMPGTYPFKSPSQSGTIVAGAVTNLTCPLPKPGQDGTAAIPTEFALYPNYPNPFNPSTTIRVALPVDASVSLVVYNTLGQKVAELMSGTVAAGYHDVTFDASNLASGLYIYRIAAQGIVGKEFNSVQKMLLMK